MSISIAHRLNAIKDPVARRAIGDVLMQLQKDLAALKLQLDTHQHSALNAAPTTTTPTLNIQS